MRYRVRRFLTAATAAAAATVVAAMPAMADDLEPQPEPPDSGTAPGSLDSEPPEPEVLDDEPPPLESTETRTGPRTLNFTPAFVFSLRFPNAQAQAVNDWSCVPDEDTNPVVLVHGTYANQYDSFARMAPELADAGHCLYSFNYGVDGDALIAEIPGRYGTTGLSGNADELTAFAATVRERTGADELDMIGWSQGGTLINNHVKDVGGELVDDVVTFGATHHGTTASGLGILARELAGEDAVEAGLGQAAVDQLRNSEYIQELNAQGDTVPGVDYTVVGTEQDLVTTPFESTFLEAGPGATVDNITLQDGCRIDRSGHISMMYSPRAIDIAKRALDPDNEGELRCRFNTRLP